MSLSLRIRIQNLLSLFSLLLLANLLVPQAFATELFSGEPEAISEGKDARPWVAIERHRDPHPRFAAEPFLGALNHGIFPPTAKAFGTPEPHSSQFLLHLAPGWEEGKRPNPVLLIPGANDDATRRYGHPSSTHDENFWGKPGLMQAMVDQGFSVFGISFSHLHGDNIYQGEHIANAIERIRTLLGRQDDESFQVDLVTFSKGAMAARSYLQTGPESRADTRFLTSYRSDVRRVVFQCGPMAGLDMPFRYYLYNLFSVSQKVPAPLGVKSVMVYGRQVKTDKGYIQSGYWPGQLQMLRDLREIGIPHGPMSRTADFDMSRRALVKGGRTMFLQSDGLQSAIEAGGNFIEFLNKRGLPADVEASLLAGDFPILYNEKYPKWKIPVGAQWVAPNDGLVFVKSALDTSGLTTRGAKIRDTKTLNLNHIDLSRSQEAYDWVMEQLSGE